MNPSFQFQPLSMMANLNNNDNDNFVPLSLNFPTNFALGFQQQQSHQQVTCFSIENSIGFVQSNAIPSNTHSISVATDSSSGSAGSSVRSFSAERTPLALNFVPGPYDVICARGAAAANSAGNLRFRKLIQDILPEYSKASSKLEKGLLVSRVVDAVRDMTPNGGFVKKIGNRWYEVGDAACREKIGQCIRDQLHTQYKSSTKSKKPRRQELKALKKERQQKKNIVKQPEPSKCPSKDAADEDDNEMSLTNIFYTALVDDGLNLETIFQC